MQHLGTLPIIKTHEPAGIAGHYKLAVWADGDVDGITGAVVAFEDLLAVLPEAVCGGVNNDLII